MKPIDNKFMAGLAEKGGLPNIEVNTDTGETPQELQARAGRQQARAARRDMLKKEVPKEESVDLTEDLKKEVLDAYKENGSGK